MATRSKPGRGKPGGWEGTPALRSFCREKREECNAPAEERNAHSGEIRAWRSGKEPKTGHRHRTVGGQKEGREGSASGIPRTNVIALAPQPWISLGTFTESAAHNRGERGERAR